MCDTFVALGNSTVDGSVILAKNSDREPNEAQEIVIIPAMDHPEASQTACTYISIPQVPHTYSVMLAKPFWMWGAEMGVNEHGPSQKNVSRPRNRPKLPGWRRQVPYPAIRRASIMRQPGINSRSKPGWIREL